MFYNNTLLLLINLSDNKIHTFNLNLNKFIKLVILNLNNNRLKFLSEILFKEFIMKYTYLYIKNNEFTCDCNMYWMASMNGDFNSTLDIQNNICQSSKLKNTSLECFIKKNTGQGKCNNINAIICSRKS